MQYKKIILPILGIIICKFVDAQNLHPNALVYANKLSDVIRDSIGLSESLRNNIFQSNVFIALQQKEAFQTESDPIKIQERLQKIESKRDSVYQSVLPDSTFQIYLQKKKNIFHAL